jgi:hypothetical protein
MKYSYRITKYDPLGSECSNSEWTSFFDIGESVSEEEYLLIETDYIETVIAICQCLGASTLIISSLEINSEGEPYTEGQSIEVDRLAPVLQAILREQIWCKLKSASCEFHFGYDYYMYLISETDAALCFPKEKSKLFFEAFPSPYLNS